MTQITAPEVIEERRSLREDDIDRLERHGSDLVVAQMVTDLGTTRSMLTCTIPNEWERVAAVLYALLERYPFVDSPRYSGERVLLGAFASELRNYARLAGEPVGGERDLRAREVVDGEREARDRAAMRHAD